MKPTKFDNVLSYAVELEDQARAQASRASKLPFLAGYIALMPDAHWGMGATIGSVIPTVGALVPSAVGVDIGCGMVAARLNLSEAAVVGAQDEILDEIARLIPAGLGKWRASDDRYHESVKRLRTTGLKVTDITGPDYLDRVVNQLGTLGSGNHFIELCADEEGMAWVVLHSGSRGIGNKLAQHHIARAKGIMKDYFIELEDPELAYLVEGTPQFDAYVNDLLWAQKYAMANRAWMTDLVLEAVQNAVAPTEEYEVEYSWVINCHHNYAEMEHHHGKNMWITRKGAIRAREDEYGVIPGSMGTGSFVVRGLGNQASYHSAAHGAGRKMSRTRARKELSVDSLREQMGKSAWLKDKAEALLDEHPESYKDLGEVMAAQSELVEPVHQLRTLINYKGV